MNAEWSGEVTHYICLWVALQFLSTNFILSFQDILLLYTQLCPPQLCLSHKF
jgi:hypothetical protein